LYNNIHALGFWIVLSPAHTCDYSRRKRRRL